MVKYTITEYSLGNMYIIYHLLEGHKIFFTPTILEDLLKCINSKTTGKVLFEGLEFNLFQDELIYFRRKSYSQGDFTIPKEVLENSLLGYRLWKS